MPITKIIIAPTFALLTLFGCASNVAVYEAPTSGPLSEITFVNAAKNQDISLITFDDGSDCTGRRSIQFEGEHAIPAGSSRSLIVGAGREFALFVTLNTIESDDYAVELGATGGGPAPIISRSVLAIGCNAQISFPVEPSNGYHIVITEPASTGSCAVGVSKLNAQGLIMPVETTERDVRSPRGDSRSYCEPPRAK